jgi:acetyl-CoA acetyltransferase
MSNRRLYGETAIVGLGYSDYPYLYRNPDVARTREELAIMAARDAIADAGLTKGDIDGLIMTGVSRYEPFMFRSGLKDVRFLAMHPPSGRMAPVALAHASMAVYSGLADYVLLFHSVTFRSSRSTFGGDTPGGGLGDLYDHAFGLTSPGAFYAMALSRYFEQYGGDERQLGVIPVTIRGHASLNDNAIMQTRYTLDEYLQCRYIARPLRLYDYCLVNDGCVAYIITSRERARDLQQPPVLIASFAERANVREWYVSEDFWQGACASLKRDLLDTVGLGLEDIDSLEVYDNFSPSVLWVLEGFGFAPIGGGLEWVQDGRISIGGELPVNTSGGMLSESYLQGWNNHASMVEQLRGTAGPRQVENCKAVLYACLSAVPGGDVLIREDFAR